MKKRTFSLLVILAAMLMLSSCGEEAEQTPDVPVNEPAEEITETKKYIDDVPEDLRCSPRQQSGTGNDLCRSGSHDGGKL